MTTCLLCGQCCHSSITGKMRKCKHLVTKLAKPHCRIYKTRIGAPTGNLKNICVPRKDGRFDYPGCPYNTDKPIRLMDGTVEKR